MSRLRWLFRRRHAKDELAREIDAHIAERVDDLVEGGVSPEHARATAMREFGNSTLQIEESREVWIAPWLTSVWQDLRYAVRSLARQPGFTVTAVGILAVGIGLATTLFTVINGLFLRPWPVPSPSSLVIVSPQATPGQLTEALSSVPEYRYLREHGQLLSHLAATIANPGVIRTGNTSSYVQSSFVSANYFATLRIGMQRGRSFLAEDENYVSPRAVVVISDRLWRESFQSTDAIVGSPLLLNGQSFVVIGVAEPGFLGVSNANDIDVWAPVPSLGLVHTGSDADSWRRRMSDPASGALRIIGRLKNDVTREQVQAEIDGLGRAFATSTSTAMRLFDVLPTRPIRSNPALLFREMPSVGFVAIALLLLMLLACANVGNLILARGMTRRREIAIRLSLGASRSRVARQLLTESVVICFAAGIVGVWIATLTTNLERHLGTNQSLEPDGPVFAFALLLALVACLASGVMPMLRSTKVPLVGRASERHAGDAGAGPLRMALLAAQIAVSMVLLVGAGLMTRAASVAFQSDWGFAVHEAQTLRVQLPREADGERRAVFARALHASLDASGLPPLASAEFNVISGVYRAVPVRTEGESPVTGELVGLGVSQNYFSVLRIPFVAGRSLSDDTQSDEVVVNEMAASFLWPGEDPLGRRLVSETSDSYRSFRVVGVVKDVTHTAGTLRPVMYQSGRSHHTFFVRDLSSSIVQRVTAIAQGIEPRAQVVGGPLTNELWMIMRPLLWASYFAWAASALALILSIAGAFGVFAYLVEERRREIGVRIALGAGARQVVWTVVSGAGRALALGLGVGLLLSVAGGALLRNYLYGLSPFDPITYLGIAAILVAAALLATWIPARRATRIDPAITLRGD